MATLRTFAWLAFALGCASTEDPLALDEPIVAHQAEFKKGALPGSTTPVEGRPAITSVEYGTGSLRPGAQLVPIAGRASGSAYSVGIQLLDQGSGYWIRPVGAEDLLTPGELTWEFSFDVGYGIEPGLHQLALVAFDEKGRAGQQSALEVCVASDLPDEGNGCNPEREPPEAIAALRWNTDADLDLIVIAPDGTRYGRSNFSRLEGDEVVARLDGDGTSGCVLDGRHSEHFVWSKPLTGSWYVYANLFDACQKTAVEFELTTYRKKKGEDGTFSLEAGKTVGGELLRAQTTPGGEYPLYLTRITFP